MNSNFKSLLPIGQHSYKFICKYAEKKKKKIFEPGFSLDNSQPNYLDKKDLNPVICVITRFM